MKKNKIYILFLLLGLGWGVFVGLNKVRASSPVNESSAGEQTAGVAYDESWKATEALVSSSSGYRYFYPYGSSPAYPLPANPVNQQTATAGKLVYDNDFGWKILVYPKMVVTKWRVHGHIHFR